MKLATTLSALLLFALSQFSYSHGDHEHEQHTINNADAQRVGLKTAKLFSEVDAKLGFGKLPENWSSLTLEATSLHTSGDGYYIVAVENKTETKTLYVLMSRSGDVFDANFSGEFLNLKDE